MEKEMKLEKIQIDRLKEDPNNLREHSVENIEMIKNSIKEYGQYKPLIVDKSTMIVKAGNGRLRAMKELGYTECNCILMDASDSLAVIDNRLNELSEWNDDELNKWLKNEKGLDWFGIDIDLSNELLKLKDDTEKKEKKQTNNQPKIKLCPCCGKPLKKKNKMIIT